MRRHAGEDQGEYGVNARGNAQHELASSECQSCINAQSPSMFGYVNSCMLAKFKMIGIPMAWLTLSLGRGLSLG
jgi:hypothetical protein